MSKTHTTARMQCNGKLRKRHPDGAEEVVPEAPMAPISETDIEAAAATDADNPPMMPEQEGQLRRIPRVKTLRRALGLTQEEFSARYHIPLGTLRDWEQGRSQPDQPARAFLSVIARAPREVGESLLNCGHFKIKHSKRFDYFHVRAFFEGICSPDLFSKPVTQVGL